MTVGPGLTIRKEQLGVFSQEQVRKFEDWMVAHLTRFFPCECAAEGSESQVLDLVRYGIGRAAAHGITTKRDVCKYIDLMIVLGRDFDADTRFGWAAAILKQPWQSSVKISALRDSVKDHFIHR